MEKKIENVYALERKNAKVLPLTGLAGKDEISRRSTRLFLPCDLSAAKTRDLRKRA